MQQKIGWFATIIINLVYSYEEADVMSINFINENYDIYIYYYYNYIHKYYAPFVSSKNHNGVF